MLKIVMSMALSLAMGIGSLAAQGAGQGARGEVPARDVAGMREPAGLQRYSGSILIDAASAAFDEVTLANAPLVRVPGRQDPRNNALFLPPSPLKVEGRRTRLIYVVPQGRSPLEVVRGYQQVVREAGGTALFECATEECGGDIRRGATSGGDRSGLIHMAIAPSEVPPNGAPVQCAVDNSARSGQRYALLQLPGNGGYLAVLTYVLGDYVAASACRNWTGRTVAVVTHVETRDREQRMEMVRADAMGASMARDGKVTFYAILFDTARADIRPESQPQLAEMVTYLRANPALRVMIVGHTDSQGGIDYNVDLSRRRAASVISALVAQGIAAGRLVPQGVGLAAPVSTNDTDEGRAKNRRVEMVKL